ncbi:putative ABC transporter permease [Bacilliculturomica massiliensis]|uniref:putative ABC transporter permease n=1 Tax=Bacilliculturomica massiliensis TaxID=1917867 RepID=UPI001031E23E|nr:putative ABC transporter permease [Bacilliculturomica massiliensis]
MDKRTGETNENKQEGSAMPVTDDPDRDIRRGIFRGLWAKAERYFFCFVLYCILGWIYEVVLGLLYGWGFENRGFLFGPWLPVYGVGALLLVFLLGPVKEKKRRLAGLPVTPLLVFLLTVLITTILEYITGAALWALFQRRWWDYSGDFMNLNGFICPRTSIRFGLGGLFFLYVCQPCFEWFWDRITEKAGHVITGVLAALILLDFAHTMYAMM